MSSHSWVIVLERIQISISLVSFTLSASVCIMPQFAVPHLVSMTFLLWTIPPNWLKVSFHANICEEQIELIEFFTNSALFNYKNGMLLTLLLLQSFRRHIPMANKSCTKSFPNNWNPLNGILNSSNERQPIYGMCLYFVDKLLWIHWIYLLRVRVGVKFYIYWGAICKSDV